MAVKIRLARHGKKGFAFYHIVAADSRIRIGIVGTQFLDEFTITWRSAICGNDVIEGITLLTVTCQTNFNSHLL